MVQGPWASGYARDKNAMVFGLRGSGFRGLGPQGFRGPCKQSLRTIRARCTQGFQGCGVLGYGYLSSILQNTGQPLRVDWEFLGIVATLKKGLKVTYATTRKNAHHPGSLSGLGVEAIPGRTVRPWDG